MRRLTRIGRAAVMGVMLSSATVITHVAFAQGGDDAGPQDPQGVQRATARAVTAMLSVQKIDKSTRLLTLKTADGETFDAKAGPDVDLDRLRVGDPVRATYYEEVAMGIRTTGQTGPKTTQTTVERDGVTAQQSTLTARIVSVDADKNTVVLRDPQSRMHSVKVVDPDVQAELDRIKPGDVVDVTYTQAVAISIQPTR
jgi:hypothetical protein